MVSGSCLLKLMAPMNFFWLRFWRDQAATPSGSKHSLTLTLNYRLSNMTADIHYSKAGRKCVRSNLQRDQSHYALMLLWQLEAKQTCTLTTLLTQTTWAELPPSDLSSTIKPWWGHREKKFHINQIAAVSPCSVQLRGRIGVSAPTSTWQNRCLFKNSHIGHFWVGHRVIDEAHALSGTCSEWAICC